MGSRFCIWEENVVRAIHKYKEPIYGDFYKNLKPKMGEYVMEYHLDKPDLYRKKNVVKIHLPTHTKSMGARG